ncbi:MAG: SufE family protein [Melioribacteraceae bacterium]
MTIKEKQDQLVREFENFTEWDDKYAYLIKLGRELPELPEEFRTEKYKINGCQSQVWINAKYLDGKVVLEADSDAAIVKGLIAILIKIYSAAKPEEILSNPPDFLSKIGIDNHLSPTRKNGLGAMLKQIQMYAFALKAMKK